MTSGDTRANDYSPATKLKMAMRRLLQQRALYFITPSVGTRVPSSAALVQIVEDAIRGGVDIIQWRQKPKTAELEALPELRAQWEQRSDAEPFLLPVAREIRALSKRHRVPFIVNDSLDLALALNADGVHIGQTDSALRQVRQRVEAEKLQDFIIGVTVRDGTQARAACENGATYLGAGPVFSSSTKPEANDGQTIGIEGLRECTLTANEYGVPVFAIGGIDMQHNRIQSCIADGHAAGVAVIAAISSASDREAATKAIRQEIVRSIESKTV
ncbi:hypothetical protein PINS_up001857 [Pythium insidiosum]|nr:hypothetical protein PINS_up001857 [Pythium insidiosum]